MSPFPVHRHKRQVTVHLKISIVVSASLSNIQRNWTFCSLKHQKPSFGGRALPEPAVRWHCSAPTNPGWISDVGLKALEREKGAKWQTKWVGYEMGWKEQV